MHQYKYLSLTGKERISFQLLMQKINNEDFDYSCALATHSHSESRRVHQATTTRYDSKLPCTVNPE